MERIGSYPHFYSSGKDLMLPAEGLIRPAEEFGVRRSLEPSGDKFARPARFIARLEIRIRSHVKKM